MVLGKGKKGAFCIAERGGILEVADPESGLTQTLREVVAIEPAVVVLAKDAGALLGVGNRIILEGCCAVEVNGRKQYSPPAFAEDAMEFPHRLSVVGHMLHEVVADNHVERFVGERNLLNIKVGKNYIRM